MFVIDRSINPGIDLAPFGSLPHLVSWLERQPQDEIYCYTEIRECLVAQYYKEHVPEFSYCSPNDWVCKGNKTHELPQDLDSVARGYYMPDGREYETCARTFGAALTRARKLLSERGA